MKVKELKLNKLESQRKLTGGGTQSLLLSRESICIALLRKVHHDTVTCSMQQQPIEGSHNLTTNMW